MAEQTPGTPADIQHLYNKPAKIRYDQTQAGLLGQLIDIGFFLLATVATIAFAFDVLFDAFSVEWSHLVLLIPFWVIIAYLVMPRIHSLLTSIYVPDYFFGRARTSDGLLGDPINLAVDGTARDIHTAMTRAGWSLADDITLKSSLGIVASSVLRRSYPQAPVSPLLVFGRRQCLAYQQEIDGNASQRHHVRFWRCPDGWYLPGGEQVAWVGAGTYDRAVGFSLFTLQITHKIDADIDIERDFIIHSVESANPEARHRIIENFSTGYHSRNGGGDLVRTDGNLPVLDVRAVPHDSDPATLPYQVVRAAAGYHAPSPEQVPGLGGVVSPDDDIPVATMQPFIEQATRKRRPWTLTLGCVMAWLIVALEVMNLLQFDLGEIIAADYAPGVLAAQVVLWIGLVLAAYHTLMGSLFGRITTMALATINPLLGIAVSELTEAHLIGSWSVIVPMLNLIVLLTLSGDVARRWSRIMTWRRYEHAKRSARARELASQL
ncbi:LssY C-terminal domain-containing protein [Corynebacterium choanae]|uniref:LssY-like C-terminal domain-containing protein n=1 Tax=Corynebacterium choanae TaxID=1862358 RepID=A0A3G6J6S4_9CORY|nr:LssY C-terminal domain-containing protein [Corynebacterium choanae]AZA13463.1 hypothetical protein CCHOA_05295 [Corynebacterium choanae]